MSILQAEVDTVLERFAVIDIRQALGLSPNVSQETREAWNTRWSAAQGLAALIKSISRKDIPPGTQRVLHLLGQLQGAVREIAQTPLGDRVNRIQTSLQNLDRQWEAIVALLPDVVREKLIADSETSRLLQDRENHLLELQQHRREQEATMRAQDESLSAAREQIAQQSQQLQTQLLEMAHLQSLVAAQGLGHAKGIFSENVRRASVAALVAGVLATLALAGFGTLASIFYREELVYSWPEVFWAKIFFRAFILAVNGAIIFILIQITRAYLQVREMNLHRAEIAKSFEPIVSGASPANRDQILLLLVGGLVQMGETGLLSSPTSSSPNAIVDLVSNLLPQQKS